VIKVIGGAACRTVVIKGNLQIINGMGRTEARRTPTASS
jgi:hypothetical protein